MRIGKFNMLALILTILIGSLLYVLLFTGYLFVITNPGHATLPNLPDINYEKATINGNEMIFSEKNWTLDKWRTYPKPFFGGLTKVSLEYNDRQSNDDSSYLSMHLDFDFSEAIPIGKKVTLTDANFIKKLHIWNNDSYLGIARDNKYYCGFDNSIIDGTVLISKLNQDNKKLIFSGEINVKPSSFAMNFKCKNGEFFKSGNSIVEIRNLTFSIDSPVIYEWSNKGGKTWRL